MPQTLLGAPPMTIDSVLRLKPIAGKPQKLSADELKMISKPPEMETMDGLSFPKGGTSIAVPAGASKDGTGPQQTDGFIPANVAHEFVPPLEPRQWRKPIYIDRNEYLPVSPVLNPVTPLTPLKPVVGRNGQKTIFGADGRRVFYSTAYPWRCIGRVESSLGFASGVMIGPRHLLTCAHIVDWLPGNVTGWLKFSPMYYNGATPYGTAWATRTYFKHKVAGPTIDGTEIQYDYVCIVLDRTIGNLTGWMGSKAYSDSWDGQAYWTHAGYPGDLTGCQRPTYQNSIALDGDFWSFDDNESIAHKADIWPGQSGGPFWAYWDGQPYAVATQSAHNPNDNFASGGSDLVDLVRRARAEHP